MTGAEVSGTVTVSGLFSASPVALLVRADA
jgi:hypothetical protein